jgi:SAM-dependent methyltransferase
MLNPRRTSRFHLHRNHLLRFINPLAMRGLEIGAFDLPHIEPSEGHCVFADYRSHEELIALAKACPPFEPDFVVPVQYDLRQGYDAIPADFDWICGSHVVEHVPDLIGWLNQLASKLNPDGIVFLVVPDKRFTFDYFRREMTVSEFISAHRAQLVRPSFAQAFDHIFYTTNPVDPSVIWAGGAPPSAQYDFLSAMAYGELAEREYADAHCSVFTPESFIFTITQLHRAGLTPFRINEICATSRDQNDFSVVLTKQ